MTSMEDNGLELDDYGCRTSNKKQNRRKLWKKFIETATAVLLMTGLVLVILTFFNILGELTVRDKYVKSVETVVVTGVHDNSIGQYVEGNEIHSRQYIYYLDYVDSAGVQHRHEVDHWSPWLGWQDDSASIHKGDTIRLYKFSSDGIFDMNGRRLVFEKGGNFYE